MELLTSGFRPMPGVQVGHWTERTARTGCTVLRFDDPALTAADVRGAAPGSRELALLEPGRAVQRPDAILLTGGSAMGLAAAGGVMQWLREHDRGYATPAGPVPIVPGAVIFDLAVGASRFPDADDGYAAMTSATPFDQLETGAVGAGTGATIGTIAGPDNTRASGMAAAQVVLDEGIVAAIVVLNAFGVPRGGRQHDPRMVFLDATTPPPTGESTTLMSCITDIPLDHDALIRMTVAMHDGLARSVVPVHTVADGDIAFATTVREASRIDVAASLRSGLAAELAVEAAIDAMRIGD